MDPKFFNQLYEETFHDAEYNFLAEQSYEDYLRQHDDDAGSSTPEDRSGFSQSTDGYQKSDNQRTGDEQWVGWSQVPRDQGEQIIWANQKSRRGIPGFARQPYAGKRYDLGREIFSARLRAELNSLVLTLRPSDILRMHGQLATARILQDAQSNSLQEGPRGDLKYPRDTLLPASDYIRATQILAGLAFNDVGQAQKRQIREIVRPSVATVKLRKPRCRIIEGQITGSATLQKPRKRVGVNTAVEIWLVCDDNTVTLGDCGIALAAFFTKKNPNLVLTFKVGSTLLYGEKQFGDLPPADVDVIVSALGGAKKGKGKKGKGKPTPRPQTSTVRRVFNALPKMVANVGRTVPPISLSKCALKYALAVVDPFNPAARGACLPTSPAPPSQKATSYQRLSVGIGTAGFGFIIVSPCLANDCFNAIYSSATFTGADAAAIFSANNTLGVGVVTARPTSLPFSGAEFTSGAVGNAVAVSGRMVSCGVQACYTGTTFNESGTISLLSEPEHLSVTAVYPNLALVNAMPMAQVSSFNRGECYQAYCYPISTGETEYAISNAVSLPNTLYPYANETNTVSATGSFTFANPVNCGNIGSAPMILMFTGVATSTVLVEIIQHLEFVGENASAALTVSDSDIQGYAMVTAAAQRVPMMKASFPRAKPFDLLKEAIVSISAALKPIALKALTAATVAAFV